MSTASYSGLIVPIPVGELDLDCAWCRKRLEEEACYDGDKHHFCEACLETLVQDLDGKATAYAEANVEITGPIPDYDPLLEYRCTPEEYRDGFRESYSPKAYRAFLRHKRSNYDHLIKNLGKSVFDRIFYLAIRDRVDALLDDAIDL